MFEQRAVSWLNSAENKCRVLEHIYICFHVWKQFKRTRACMQTSGLVDSVAESKLYDVPGYWNKYLRCFITLELIAQPGWWRRHTFYICDCGWLDWRKLDEGLESGSRKVFGSFVFENQATLSYACIVILKLQTMDLASTAISKGSRPTAVVTGSDTLQ